MKAGDTVRLRAYSGEEIVRRVLAVNKKVVVVCRHEEYEKAMQEGRTPVGVGFRLSNVIQGITS